MKRRSYLITTDSVRGCEKRFGFGWRFRRTQTKNALRFAFRNRIPTNPPYHQGGGNGGSVLLHLWEKTNDLLTFFLSSLRRGKLASSILSVFFGERESPVRRTRILAMRKVMSLSRLLRHPPHCLEDSSQRQAVGVIANLAFLRKDRESRKYAI